MGRGVGAGYAITTFKYGPLSNCVYLVSPRPRCMYEKVSKISVVDGSGFTRVCESGSRRVEREKFMKFS